MTKCDFCKTEKEIKRILSRIDDEHEPVEYNICQSCAKIECPYLNWNKL